MVDSIFPDLGRRGAPFHLALENRVVVVVTHWWAGLVADSDSSSSQSSRKGGRVMRRFALLSVLVSLVLAVGCDEPSEREATTSADSAVAIAPTSPESVESSASALTSSATPCGEPGQICCGHTCRIGRCVGCARCWPLLCKACGGSGEICCLGGTCNAGLSCVSGTCR